MLRTDLVTPATVGLPSLVRHTPAYVRLGFCVIAVFTCVGIGAVQCSAQDVADAAKQERARKEGKKPKHVYTEDDLKRAQILTPEDRAELEAKRNQTSPDAASYEQALDSLPVTPYPNGSTIAPVADPSAVTTAADSNPLPADAPLGDVARYYRRWKDSQALRREEQFPLAIPRAPVLASPKPLSQPLRPPLPSAEPAAPLFDSRQLVVRPSRPSPRVVNPAAPEITPFQPPVKRSPFARPRFLAAVPPRVPSSRPAPPSLAAQPPTAPAAPANSSKSFSVATPSRPVAPARPSQPTRLNPPAIVAPSTPTKPLASAAPSAPVTGRSNTFSLAIPSRPVAPARPSQPTRLNPPALVAPSTPTRPLASPAPSAPENVPSVAPAMPSGKIAPVRPLMKIAPAPSTKLNVVAVKPGDSLWKLAEQHLGQGLRWHDLLAANPNIRDANHIEAGSQIFLPAAAPSPSVTKMIVQNGDSLSKIARAHFGRASSWSCIARANPSITDANLIYAGQMLLLPASCKTE